ncbi:MAG: hypothetical protein LDL16_07275 [Thiobacillus sp.]|nr:hypothetical protein [Thiobacillus sp.]
MPPFAGATSGGRVNPVGPRACYDEGRRCAGTLFFDYRRQPGIELENGLPRTIAYFRECIDKGLA